MKIVTLLLTLLVNASLCEDYKITFFLSRGYPGVTGIKHHPLVIVNGTREDTEYQECTADLSVLGSNSSCTIKVNQDIGEFKCLKISKNAPDDDENIGDHAMNEDGYIRKERLSITLLIVELPNKATKYFAASGHEWSYGVSVYNSGKNFCDFTDELPSWNKWVHGPWTGVTVIKSKGGLWYLLFVYTTGILVIPVSLILIITFCGIACCRGKVCPCCNKTKVPDLQNIVTVQASMA